MQEGRDHPLLPIKGLVDYSEKPFIQWLKIVCKGFIELL